MARTNVIENKPAVFTHEGAKATPAPNALAQLRRSVLSCMLFEGEFYEDGESIAERIQKSATALLRSSGGETALAALAMEARSEFKLRHVPLLLLVTLIRYNTEDSRAVVAPAIEAVIQRPDEMGELISLFWKYEGRKTTLTNQMKKGLRDALVKFSEYQLAKFDQTSAAVKLRDVLFLIHAKPENKEQKKLFKRIANKELETPDTWEVALSAGADKKETFTRLLKEEKLGALALLRNLRNMTEANVEEKTIRAALANIKTERVLPFRFITAARYAPAFEPELEAAMFKCLESFEKLPGKTVLCIDTSASMENKVSGKSEISRRDAAAALAMMLREICESATVIAFGDKAGVVKPRRGFALNDAIGNGVFGHGTRIDVAVDLARKEKYDRIIVITDEQTAGGNFYAGHIGDPLPKSKGYVINVASYENGISYNSKWNHIDGWSEAVIDFIQEIEKL